MHEIKRRKLARTMGIASLFCPICLAILLVLMHQGAFAFRDDFHGFRGVGFFMACLVILLPAGALFGSVGIYFQRNSLFAVLGLLVNLGVMVVFILMF